MTTGAGKRLLAFLAKQRRNDRTSSAWCSGVEYAKACVAATLPSIEAEAIAAERERWRRIPGSYRLPDGSTEIVVDVPESASFIEDEFPDEVAAIVAAERERIEAAVAGLGVFCPGDTAPLMAEGSDAGFMECLSRAAVLAIIRGDSHV